jgi:predicted branched-subunit amino acid permease
MKTMRSAFIAGFRDQSPGIIGNVPFGLITGAAASAAGVDPWLAIGMSVIMFAGAAQLAVISLMAQHAPGGIVVLTVLIVNLRMMMYSAAMAPYFRHTPPARKWLFSYLMTDHVFALITTKFDHQRLPQNLDAYYLGATSTMWWVWQISVATGIFAGAQVPAKWSLDFAIPLVFLSLVLPAIHTRSHWAAAIAAAAAAAFCASLPFRLGLIVGAFTGVIVGLCFERLARPATATPGVGHDRLGRLGHHRLRGGGDARVAGLVHSAACQYQSARLAAAEPEIRRRRGVTCPDCAGRTVP